MGFSQLIMLRLIVLAAGAAAVQVEPSKFGPGPPYAGRPGPYVPQNDQYPEPARAYKPKPIYLEEEEEYLPPQPYTYEYGVSDDYSKAAFAKSESQNDVGAVTGSYKVNLPDGRIQTVTYTADPVNGYKAVVSYEGEPVYPPEPEEGYGNQYKQGPARVYRDSPNHEYIEAINEDRYLPEYVERVQ